MFSLLPPQKKKNGYKAENTYNEKNSQLKIINLQNCNLCLPVCV